jgi:hypothetical protein
MLGWITEPLVWFICIVYLPYLTFRAAATDDGQHIHYAVTWWVLSTLTIIQTMPVVYTLLQWVPLYYEMKFILVLLAMYTRASMVVYRRVFQPIFARHIKTPEELAKLLPLQLQNEFATLGLHKFGANFVQHTPHNLLEYGFPTYRLVCTMLIQSATDPVVSNTDWEATEMGLASGFASAAAGVGGVVVAGVGKGIKMGMNSMSQSDRNALATAAATSAMKSSVEMGL